MLQFGSLDQFDGGGEGTAVGTDELELPGRGIAWPVQPNQSII